MNNMSAVTDLNIKRLEGIAIWMAPALRDKFDFGNVMGHLPDESRDWDDNKKLAWLSFEAAKAIVAHSDSLLATAEAKDKVEADRAAKLKEKSELEQLRAKLAATESVPPADPAGGEKP